MKTACVILNYNDSQTTLNLVEKIKEYKGIDYIVLVDNCSTDNSFIQLSKHVCEKIHVIKTEKNGGYGYGNNWGILYTHEKLDVQYVAIANPDVEFSEKCYISLINALVEDPFCGAVAPVSFDSNMKHSKTIAWKQTSIIIEVLLASVLISRLLRRVTQYNSEYIFSGSHICEVDIIPGSFLMLNIDLFLLVGMYDEDIFLYCEEKVLGWKYSTYGIKTKLVTNVDYIHWHSVTIEKNISSHVKKTGIWLESKKHFIKKYMLKNKNLSFLIEVAFAVAKIESIIIECVKRVCDAELYFKSIIKR